MLEKEIEQNLKLEINKLGGLAIKFVSPGFTGLMDRLILLPYSIVFFVETKRPGKNLRKRQEYVRKQFEELGMKVYKIDTKEKVKDLCNTYREIIKNLQQDK